MGSEEIAVSRRDFLGLSWRVIAALAAGQAGCFGLRFLASRKVEGMLGEVVTAGIVEDFPVGTITPFDTQRFFVVRFEDGGFLALHAKCTHLGCAVTWNERSGRFVCPCHGSEFDQHGDVLVLLQRLDRVGNERDTALALSCLFRHSDLHAARKIMR